FFIVGLHDVSTFTNLTSSSLAFGPPGAGGMTANHQATSAFEVPFPGAPLDLTQFPADTEVPTSQPGDYLVFSMYTDRPDAIDSIVIQIFTSADDSTFFSRTLTPNVSPEVLAKTTDTFGAPLFPSAQDLQSFYGKKTLDIPEGVRVKIDTGKID